MSKIWTRITLLALTAVIVLPTVVLLTGCAPGEPKKPAANFYEGPMVKKTQKGGLMGGNGGENK